MGIDVCICFTPQIGKLSYTAAHDRYRRNWPDAKSRRREEWSWQRAQHVQRPSVRTAWHVQDDKNHWEGPQRGGPQWERQSQRGQAGGRQTSEELMCYVLELWLMEENVVRAEGGKEISMEAARKNRGVSPRAAGQQREAGTGRYFQGG